MTAAVAVCLLWLLMAPMALAQNNSTASQALPNTKTACKGATDTRSDGLDVFETVIDAPLSRLFWGNGDDSRLVFVLTKRLTVYRSDDDGVTWSDLSNNSTLSPGGQARVSQIVAVEGDPARFYFVSSDYHGLWTTRDGGVTFAYKSEFHESRPWVSLLIPHTDYPDVAVAVGWIDQHANLYLTVDFGATWTQIESYVEPNSVVFVAPGSSLASFAVLYLKQDEPRDPFNRCDLDCRAEIASVLPNGTVVQRESIFTKVDDLDEVTWSGSLADTDGATSIVLRRDSLVPSESNGTVLSISKDHGKSWRDAVFPFEQDVDASFAIVTSTLGVGEIVAARPSSHDQHVNRSTWADLYISRSENSSRFVRILPFVKLSAGEALWGNVDAELGYDVDGVLLANSFRVKPGVNSTFDESARDGTCLQTRLTTNYGTTWAQPRASMSDCIAAIGAAAANAPASSDASPCALQLFGLSTVVQGGHRFYSAPGAVGIWFAPGHIGTCMNTSLSVNETSLFFSNDAGTTWKRLSAGTFTFEITAKGSILVTAEAAASSMETEINYSVDYGENFHKCAATTTPFNIYNVETRYSPSDRDRTDFNSQSFIMYGEREDNKGVLLTLSFKKTWRRNCTAADYEPWLPSFTNDSTCHLGGIESYTRRKFIADCDVAFDAPLTVKSAPCPCTESDYECDFCFERVDGVCLPIRSTRCFNGFARYRQCRPPSNADQNITFLSGYLLQPNNKCNASLPGAVYRPSFVNITCDQPCEYLGCSACASTNNRCRWCAANEAKLINGTCETVAFGESPYVCNDQSAFVARVDQCSALPPTPRPTGPVLPPTPVVNPFIGRCENATCSECAQRFNCVFCSSALLPNGFTDWSRGRCSASANASVCQLMTTLRSASQCNDGGRQSRWNCTANAENLCIQSCGGSALNVATCHCETGVAKCQGDLCNMLGTQECARKCEKAGGVERCDCSQYNSVNGGDVEAVCRMPLTRGDKKGIGGLAIFFIILAVLVALAMVAAVIYAIKRKRGGVVVA